MESLIVSRKEPGWTIISRLSPRPWISIEEHVDGSFRIVLRNLSQVISGFPLRTRFRCFQTRNEDSVYEVYRSLKTNLCELLARASRDSVSPTAVIEILRDCCPSSYEILPPPSSSSDRNDELEDDVDEWLHEYSETISSLRKSLRRPRSTRSRNVVRLGKRLRRFETRLGGVFDEPNPNIARSSSMMALRMKYLSKKKAADELIESEEFEVSFEDAKRNRRRNGRSGSREEQISIGTDPRRKRGRDQSRGRMVEDDETQIQEQTQASVRRQKRMRLRHETQMTVQTEADIAQETRRDLERVETNFNEVVDMLGDMHHLVDENQFLVDSIEDHVISATSHIKKGRGEVRKAREHQKMGLGRLILKGLFRV